MTKKRKLFTIIIILLFLMISLALSSCNTPQKQLQNSLMEIFFLDSTLSLNKQFIENDGDYSVAVLIQTIDNFCEAADKRFSEEELKHLSTMINDSSFSFADPIDLCQACVENGFSKEDVSDLSIIVLDAFYDAMNDTKLKKKCIRACKSYLNHFSKTDITEIKLYTSYLNAAYDMNLIAQRYSFSETGVVAESDLAEASAILTSCGLGDRLAETETDRPYWLIKDAFYDVAYEEATKISSALYEDPIRAAAREKYLTNEWDNSLDRYITQYLANDCQGDANTLQWLSDYIMTPYIEANPNTKIRLPQNIRLVDKQWLYSLRLDMATYLDTQYKIAYDYSCYQNISYSMQKMKKGLHMEDTLLLTSLMGIGIDLSDTENYQAVRAYLGDVTGYLYTFSSLSVKAKTVLADKEANSAEASELLQDYKNWAADFCTYLQTIGDPATALVEYSFLMLTQELNSIVNPQNEQENIIELIKAYIPYNADAYPKIQLEENTEYNVVLEEGADEKTILFVITTNNYGELRTCILPESCLTGNTRYTNNNEAQRLIRTNSRGATSYHAGKFYPGTTFYCEITFYENCLFSYTLEEE